MNKHVEVYNSESEVLQRIEELKSQGIAERDIYVVMDRDDKLSILRRRTDVNIDEADALGGGTVQTEEKGFFEKFMDSLKGEDEVHDSYQRMDLSDTDRDRYRQEVREGKILLYVDENYRYGYEDNLSAREYDRTIDRDRVEGERTIELQEERLNVDKEQVKAGEVRVSKHVEEERASVDVPLREEEVYIERRKVDDATRTGVADDIREGEEIVVPVMEERVNVRKENVVTEEVTIGKKVNEKTEHVEDTVRKEKLNIDEDGKVVVDRDINKKDI